MGHFYPPPPSFVGGKQPYAPQLGIVQSGPVPQAPPLRGAIALATFGVILSSWQPPFFQPQGAGDIAAVIQTTAVVSQPPVPSRINLSTILRSWDPLPFIAQGAGDMAPFLPVGAAPSQPLASGRAMQAILQGAWQYGSTTQISLSTVAPFITADQPPAISGVNLQTIVQAWQPAPFTIQGAGDIAPALPIVSQPQPISLARLFTVRATWDPPWSPAYMQGAGDIAPNLQAPVVSSQPPLANTAARGLIRTAWDYDPVTIISLASVAPFVAQADQPPVPSDVNFQTILQSWIPAFVLPPRQQGIATQPIVNVPPVNTDSLFNELIAANQPPPYAIPKAGTVASWLPPASAPSQPPVLTTVSLLTVIRAWDIAPLWPIQGQADIAPMIPAQAAPSAPPVSNSAQMYALVAASQLPFILPPTGYDFAPLIPAPIPPGSPPPSLANLRLLLQSWDVGPPPSQPRAVVTASGPIPQQPPPLSRVNLQTIVQLNQPPWNYGQGFGYVAVYPIYTPQAGGPRYIVRRMRARRFTVSAVTYLQFEPLGPDEKYPLTFDFAPDLPSGVILTGMPTVTVTMNSGADATPDALVTGTAGPDVTNSQIIVPVTGRVDGSDYKVHVRSLTSVPTIVLSLSGILPIRS